MLTKFNNIEPITIENLRGGMGKCTLYKVQDLPNTYNMFAKIIIHPNSSIGLHTHETDEEMIYVLEGKGKVIVEGELKELEAGMVNVCKQHHAHSVINDSDKDLIILGIVTKGE